jgi:hypothetical protein
MQRLSLHALLLVFLTVPVGSAWAAWPNNPLVNLAVCTAANSQIAPKVVSDGRGGALLVWQDNRAPGSDYDIYVQHVLRSGAVDPVWPANGRLLCGAAGPQTEPVAIPDGSGGVLVAWTDGRVAGSEVYAGHVLATGVVDPAWPSNGLAVCTATGAQTHPTIVADAGDGALIAWTDARAGNTDIYAHHVMATGAVDAAWPANGRGLVTQTDAQTAQEMCSDRAGGAIVVWLDGRGAPLTYVMGMRVLASGALDPSWPAQGQYVSNLNGGVASPAIVSDGQSGAVVVWSQYTGSFSAIDIRAQRLTGGGTVIWSSGGELVTGATGDQVSPALVADGVGGAVVAWRDLGNANDVANHCLHVLYYGGLDQAWPGTGRRLGGSVNDAQAPVVTADGAGGMLAAWSQNFGDVYAGHGQLSGVADPTYPVNGEPICTALSSQTSPAIAADGTGGAIIAWVDSRLGTSDIFCQRIAPFGYLGTPEAEIASVRDVLGDQGGRVKLSWNGSSLDAVSDPNLSLYEIYRSVAAAPSAAAIAHGQHVTAVPRGEPRELLTTSVEGAAYYWEFVASQAPLHFVTTYSNVMATGGDSTANSPANTVFMIVARNASGTMYWLSAPDSGHSVDNLSPSVPAGFAGEYASGTATLTWAANAEPDLAGYRLYRDAEPSFVPGPTNLVATLTQTGYVDVAGMIRYYRLSAVDVHGNESPTTLFLPGSTTDVAAHSPRLALALHPPVPNPAPGAVRFAFDVPAPMRARLAIHDAAGRLVRSLREGPAGAGRHSLEWDRRDGAGNRVGRGVYWLRLEADGQSRKKRFTLL